MQVAGLLKDIKSWDLELFMLWDEAKWEKKTWKAREKQISIEINNKLAK